MWTVTVFILSAMPAALASSCVSTVSSRDTTLSRVVALDHASVSSLASVAENFEVTRPAPRPPEACVSLAMDSMSFSATERVKLSVTFSTLRIVRRVEVRMVRESFSVRWNRFTTGPRRRVGCSRQVSRNLRSTLR